MFVKKNDTVVVLAGEDKGKKGKVLRTVPSENKVVVEGINVISRHTKPRSAQDQGGIIKREAPIDASNVQVICPVCEQATRISVQITGDKKVRVCKKCGKPVDAVKEEKKAAKKATKKAPAAKTEDGEKAPAKKTTTKKTTTKKTTTKKAEDKAE